VCSAVGLVPLAIHFGYDLVDLFLAGARSVDANFVSAEPRRNIALIMGLLGMCAAAFPAHRLAVLVLIDAGGVGV
jgi:glucose-6-phosphate isomerase